MRGDGAEISQSELLLYLVISLQAIIQEDHEHHDQYSNNQTDCSSCGYNNCSFTGRGSIARHSMLDNAYIATYCLWQAKQLGLELIDGVVNAGQAIIGKNVVRIIGVGDFGQGSFQLLLLLLVIGQLGLESLAQG